ncbi:MAG: PorP/SprF family type IX secretion system membrane protein [Putridiphycobacter sp.]
MNKRIKRILAVVLLLSTNGYAQDFHLSQYDAAPLNINPALTGAFMGEYRIHGHYRNQWMAVATKPFTTGLVSFDMNKGQWGFGGQVANFRAGIGGYNVAQVMVSSAYKVRLGESKNHMLSFGVQAGAFQKSVNESSLTFASQYVKSNGGEFDQTLSSGENFTNTGFFNLDVVGGLMYTYGKFNSKFNPFVGATFYHLNMPKESFLGQVNKLPIRSQMQVGARWAINEKWTLTPKVYFQYQEKAEELTFGILGQYYMKSPDFFLLFGGTYRDDNDAVVLEIGGKYANFIGRISYDINISTLSTVTNGRGASEMSLTYVFSKPEPHPLPTCPKL